MGNWRLGTTLPGIAMLAMAVSLQGQHHARAFVAAPAFTASQLSAMPQAGWITNGGNLSNQRLFPARPDQSRQRRQSQGHGGARTWVAPAMAPSIPGQGQPIVFGGVVYISTGASDVFAVDVDNRGNTLAP